jgi:23S rRNA pseudouridine1911/1915/1917 synthase
MTAGAGMVVHPSPGHYGGTLVNAILHRYSLPAVSIASEGMLEVLDVQFDEEDADPVLPAAHPSNSPLEQGTGHCKALPQNGNEAVVRPGIVHRLDKGTTGLMVVCRTDSALLQLGEQFKARTV